VQDLAQDLLIQNALSAQTFSTPALDGKRATYLGNLDSDPLVHLHMLGS